MLKKLISKVTNTGIKETIEAGSKLIDEAFTSKEEREEAKRELLKITLDDKQNARDIYKNDSWLQKAFALTFLISWLILTGYLLKWIFSGEDTLNLLEWQIALISSIWGGISAKLNTIVDFLFGSSSGSQQKNDKLFINVECMVL